MKKSGKKENLIDRAADIFDLPGEIVAGMSRVTVTGGRRIFIENHKGILEYGEDVIAVNGGKVIIRLKGENLQLKSMSSSDLLITGRFNGIEFNY